MPENLFIPEQPNKIDNQDQPSQEQGLVLSNKEIENMSGIADESKKEEEKNPEKIDKLKEEIERLRFEEIKKEYEAQCERKLKEILDSPDSKERDDRIKRFLEERAKERIIVNLTYKPEQEVSITGKLYHSVLGDETFRMLSAYVYHNSYKDPDKLNSDIAGDIKNLPELKGVTDIKEIELENNTTGYLVKINKKDWPSAVYFGYALPRRRIAFVPDGLSEAVEIAAIDHEIYHLENHEEEKLKGLSKINFFKELETIWNTNIKDNLVGYIKLQLKGIIPTPTKIKNIVRNFLRKK